MDEELKVVLFVSRNKDNKHLDGFKERKKNFLTVKKPEELKETFERFVEEGLPGELSRFYISVKERDEKKIRKQLLHFLIDNETYPLYKLDSKVASIADKCPYAGGAWLFDFDFPEKEKVLEFVEDIKQEIFKKHENLGSFFDWKFSVLEDSEDCFKKVSIYKSAKEITEPDEDLELFTIEVYRTISGFAVVTSEGFDWRPVKEKWKMSEEDLKRDGKLLVDWKVKQGSSISLSEVKEFDLKESPMFNKLLENLEK